MQNWEGVIYTVFEQAGGEADLQYVYTKLPDLMNLSEHQLRETIWGGRPAYHHTVRSYIANMRKSKLLIRTAIGRYKIVHYKNA